MAGDGESSVLSDLAPVKNLISFDNLSKFVIKRILSENSHKKTIIAEGYFTDHEGTAILFLEKTPFTEEIFKSLCTTESILEEQLLNDIYRFYTCYPELKQGAGIKTTIIFPATESHVKKYEIQPLHLIEETSKLYNEVTLPHITSESFNIQWVYNILTHQAEQESIVFEDPDPETGFVLIPDLKWDRNQISNLYLLAIVHKHDIKSLRDLTSEHLPLLKNIKEKGTKVIEEKYGLPSSKLRIYFHYRPSYYHLHVHFTHLQFEAPGIHTEKSHMLSTVVNNIELCSNYYQLSTLPLVVKETDKLFHLFKDLGIVKETQITEEAKQEVTEESQITKEAKQEVSEESQIT